MKAIKVGYKKFKVSAGGFILTCLSFLPVILKAQCPDKSWLWNRLVFLRDSSTSSPSDKLTELLRYEAEIKNCAYYFDSTHALLLQRIGANYFFLSDFFKAAQYMQQSINLINANADRPAVNLKYNIRNYYSLGWIYDSLNNVAGKMKAMDSCIAFAARFNSVDLYYIRALFEQVKYSFGIGDYQRCISYATLCEKYSRQYTKNTNNRSEYLAGVENALASLFWRVNALLISKDYENAEKLLVNKIEECKKSNLTSYLATVYSQLAEVQINEGNTTQALSDYKMAFQCERDARYDAGCRSILNNIGYKLYFNKLNDIEKALLYCRNALAYGNKGKKANLSDAFESLNILGNMANIYVRKGLFDSAYYYYHQALAQIGPQTNEQSLLNSSAEEFMKNQEVHYLASLLVDEGDALLHEYKTTKKSNPIGEAVRVYKVADKLLDRIKSEQTELQSKLFWRSDSRRLYEHAIEACYLQKNLEDAFYFFEKSRAALLNDQLNEQRWLGETDIMKETQFEKKALQLERELNASNKSSSHYSDLENELFNNKRELEHLQELTKENNPLYYQSFVDKNFITIKDVQDKILRDHQAVAELFAGDSSVYILVITEQKSYLEKINKTNFDRLSDTYRDYISNQDLINKHFIEFKNLSLQLYRLIFQNINLPIGRIIISPDGKYFPFEALVTNTQPLTYFLEDHAVSYTYSARYLLNNFNTKAGRNSYTFMGIAPVNYYNNLASLVGSDQSLKKIKNYFGNAVNITGIKASKNNFLTDYDKYKIIQLYTHATVSGSAGEPMIYFSDSVLSLSDLFYESRPATSLIVLSACETAEGKLYNGEGVFSFNRQFAALGIPSCISNLWKVDNKSSYKLTELFYKYMARGLPLDIALQQAKKEFRKTVSSKEQELPYYWAAPILVGQSNEIPLPKTFPWKWVALVSFLLVLCNWGLRRFISNRPASSHSSLKGL